MSSNSHVDYMMKLYEQDRQLAEEMQALEDAKEKLQREHEKISDEAKSTAQQIEDEEDADAEDIIEGGILTVLFSSLLLW